MAETARDMMTGGAECIGEHDTALDAAQRLRELGVGALPVCGEDARLKGMLTDRDLVIDVLAAGKDPGSTTASELAGDHELVTIGADDSAETALETMSRAQVRRLPVIDGHELIGILTQADLASHAAPEELGSMVRSISDAA